MGFGLRACSRNGLILVLLSTATLASGCAASLERGDMFESDDETETCVLNQSPQNVIFATNVIDLRKSGAVTDLSLKLLSADGVSLASDARLYDIEVSGIRSIEEIPESLATGAGQTEEVLQITRELNRASISSDSMALVVLLLEVDSNGGSAEGFRLEYSRGGKRFMADSKSSISIVASGAEC